jgi:DNA-binding MarR family transcriptional regulator
MGGVTTEETSKALLVSLMRTARLLKRTHAQAVEPQQIWVLHTLRCSGSLRLSELAARLHLDISTVSRQVRTLADAGYVGRTTDPDDRRAALLELTERGQQVLDESFERQRARLETVLEDWSPAELATLDAQLKRLAEALERADEPARAGRPAT